MDQVSTDIKQTQSPMWKHEHNTWSDLISGEKVGPMCMNQITQTCCWFGRLPLSMMLRYKERMRVGQGRTKPVSLWTLCLSQNLNKYCIDTFSFHIFTAERFTSTQVETDVPIVPYTCFLTNRECEEWTAHRCGRNLDPSESFVMICYCRYHKI